MAFLSTGERRLSSFLSAVVLSAVLVIAGLGFTLSAQTARAPQFVKWFEDNGVQQAMNWINEPSSQYFNGYTYVAWQGGTGLLPFIKRYNHTTQT